MVPLIGIPKAPRGTFTMSGQSGEEALIFIRDRHLDGTIAVGAIAVGAIAVGVDRRQGRSPSGSIAVGVDPVSRIIRVTTAVELKGWRGWRYFGIVRPC